MPDLMQFDLVAPERRLASLEASEVRLPGTEGQMTAMPDHAPTITTLRPGIVQVTDGSGAVTSYAVTGGFAEIAPDSISVLAEQALMASAENRAELEAHLEDARARVDAAEPHRKDAAQLFVDDLVQLLGDMV
jgi:F-type H+-transporting ATPase subunit epsilon